MVNEMLEQSGLLHIILLLVVTLFIPFSIFAYAKHKKKQPNHPMNKLIWLFIPLLISLLFDIYVDGFILDEVFQQVAHIILIVISIAFLLLLLIALFNLYKYGYADIEKLKRKDLIVCSIVIVFCAIFILIYVISEK